MKLTDFDRDMLKSHADGVKGESFYTQEKRAQRRLAAKGLLRDAGKFRYRITPTGRAALKEGTER